MSTRQLMPGKVAVAPPSFTPVRSGLLQRQCACGITLGAVGECGECAKKLQRRTRESRLETRNNSSVPPTVHEVLRSPGVPLDANTRAFMESRFGHDFSGVRVHTDAKAAESARTVDALAYTVGRDIVFGLGQYATHTAAGRELLAHELAHTLQQDLGRGSSLAPDRLILGNPGDIAEEDAASAARAVLTAGHTPVAPVPDGQAALRREGPADVPPAKQEAPPQHGAGAPGDVTQAGGGTGGGGTVPTTPTCQPQGLDRAAFLATAGATKDDFGLTSLDTSAVTYPGVNTNPAKPRGVTVASTTAALPAIPSVFTKAGTFIEGDMIVVGGDERSCASGKYPLKWIISPQGAQKISDGEQEHCNDFQLAFDITLKRYADAVNALAASGRVFPNDKAVDSALTRTTGVAPSNWQNVFVCLAEKSLLRDPRTKGSPSWHTPRPTLLTPTFPDCKEGRAIVSDASLPEVGKHSASEIIKGCGEKQAPSAKGGEVHGTLRVGPASDAYERQADQVARTLAGGAISIPPATLSRVSSLGMLQRVPIPIGVDPLGPIQAAQKIATNQIYAQVLGQLKTIDPMIYGYLSKAILDGPSATIRTATGVDSSVTPPVTIQFTFNLEVKTVSLPSGTDAKFDEGAFTLGGTGTTRASTSSMVMKISPNASASLAENLYHEGLHMLIYMDKLLPTSPHGAALANYQKIAQAQPGYGLISAELEVFIGLDLQNRGLSKPGAARKDANELLRDLWEEKYVRDREKAKFTAPFSNAALASAYIVKDLGELGIRTNPTDKNLISIVQKATAILDAIDRQVAAPPAAPPQKAPGRVNRPAPAP